EEPAERADRVLVVERRQFGWQLGRNEVGRGLRPRGRRGAVALHLRHRAACAVNADRKSTRLNSSYVKNSYAVFCLKKKSGRRDPDQKLDADAVYSVDNGAETAVLLREIFVDPRDELCGYSCETCIIDKCDTAIWES